MYMWAYSKCYLNLAKILRRMASTVAPSPADLEATAFTRANELARVLDCHPGFTLQLVSKYTKKDFVQKDWTQVEQALVFLKEKFSLKDVVNNNKILTLSNEEVKKRYDRLQEIGITHITSKEILIFNRLVNRTFSKLQNLKLIPNAHDPLLTMLSKLTCSQRVKDDIRWMLEQKDYEESMTVQAVHQHILAHYLCSKLNCCLEQLQKVNVVQLNKSLQETEEILNILVNDFNFPLSLIIKHLHYVIKTTSDKLRRTFNSSLLMELGIIEIAQRRPQIMVVDPEIAEKMVALLRSYDMRTEQIHSSYMIFLLNPSVVQQRMESIKQIPELWSLRVCQRFLNLIYWYNNTVKRFEVLKTTGFVAITVNSLLVTASKDEFTRKDRCWIKDHAVHFSSILGKSFEEVDQKLKTHPKGCRISLFNSQIILDTLLDYGVSKEQIFNSLYIVLYDRETVLKYYKELENRPELQPFSEWKNHPLFLDVVVYYIEREIRFTGEGVYHSYPISELRTSSEDEDLIQDACHKMEN